MSKLTRRDFIKAGIMGLVGAVGAWFLPKSEYQPINIQREQLGVPSGDNLKWPGKMEFAKYSDPCIGSDEDWYTLEDYEEDDRVMPDTEKGKFIWVGGMVRYDCASGNYALQCYSLEDEE